MECVIEERKIGQKLTIGIQTEGEEIGLLVASEDVSASCAFLADEWEAFVEAVNEADQAIKEKKKG